MSEVDNKNWKATKSKFNTLDQELEKLRVEMDVLKNMVMTQQGVIQTMQTNYAKTYSFLLKGQSTEHDFN